MKYKYTQSLTENIRGGYTQRPLIEIEIIGEEGVSVVAGLIDSGADSNLMNIQYAKDAGIPLDEKKKRWFVGIGGKRVLCYEASINFKVKGFSETFEAPVAFIDSPSVGVLLGQEGFFDIFRIKFEKDHNTFELSLSKKRGKKKSLVQ